ncbi:response regulator [Litorilituus sediminis]|uniref:Sensory/regulatory protein RpfC n=1 Tax=Litorilituus sediminis TaxID=718192 RepID=A0A4P6P753_9GAMM|nr:response regulator [Litorilituus sediminis]QBG37481.1 response regulator [Litorilituus sediminis]
MSDDSANNTKSASQRESSHTRQQQELKEKLLPIEKTQFSIGLQIPVAAFILSISIAAIVSFFFYFETQRVLAKQTSNELAEEVNLVKPIIDQLYTQAYSDTLFLSGTPPIMGLLNATEQNDTLNYQLWKNRLEQIFTKFVQNKPFYYQIRYIGVENNGLELVNVRSFESNQQVSAVPNRKLQAKSHRPYFSQAIEKALGQVFFSKIELARNYGKVEIPHKAVLRTATPIYHPSTERVFGFIIININFGEFIEQLNQHELRELSFYLANERGDFVFHPEKDKRFGFDLGKPYLMQDEFPQLGEAITTKLTDKSLSEVSKGNKQYLGHFKQLTFTELGNEHYLNLLVLKQTDVIEQTLSSFKNRSLLLGSVMALLSLALAVFAAKRIAKPLKTIAKSLENYESGKALSKLPTNSCTEIGVLARSFHNLLIEIQLALHEQEHSALLAEEAANKITAIFDNAAQGFITIDEQGKIMSFNRAAQSIFGYQEKEILEKNITLLIPKIHATTYDNAIKEAIITGLTDIIGTGQKLTAVKKSGEEFPIHLAVSKVQTDQGYIFTGIIRDISKEIQLEIAQEQNQKALLEVNERISLATDAANIGIWQYDLKQDKLTWDKWMFKIYEANKQSFAGNITDWQNAVHPDDLATATQAIEQAIQEKGFFNHEFRIVTPSGQTKFIKANARVKLNSQGHVVQVIGVNFNITKLKEVEQKHIAAKELAEETARVKAEFLASMSHEIRTPMNGVLGMLGLLMRNELSDEQMHRVKLANSSAQALLNLVNDILDFSKVEAGKLELEFIDFDLRKLLGDFAESMALKSQEKNIEIILDNSQIKHSHVKGDPGRIRQILTNLTGNAIKFTERGEIVITAKLIEKQGYGAKGNLAFHCAISDTGIGIPEDKIATLFDSFTQVDASTTRKYGGTGLGLAISKQLCQLMHGDIQVTSVLNQGSTFSFTIALQTSEQAKKVIPNINIENIAMLVVDDNATNRLVLKQQLEHWGASVTEADSGVTALNILKHSASANNQNAQPFKVAFLDMNMPGMDGAELAKRIKAEPELAELKLVMMTSMASRGDASYFSSLGFSAYFPKPTTTEDIFKAIALTLAEKNQTQAVPIITQHLLRELEQENTIEQGFDSTPSNAKELASCRLLLVEDNRINQEVARHVLAEFGITPDVAADGVEAIESLKLSCADTPYDLILMDCQMPHMDGYQTTKAIRQGDAGKANQDIIIIAMTANAMKGDKQKCLNAGMTDYLTKPIEPEQLKEKLLHYLVHNEKTSVSEMVNNKATETMPETQTPTVLAKTAKEKKGEKEEKLSVWKKEALLKRLNNNKVILEQLLKLFIDELPSQLSVLNNALKQNNLEQSNLEQLLQASHKIQGMAANISAIELHNLSKTFEQQVKANNLQALTPLLIQINASSSSLTCLISKELTQNNAVVVDD